MQQDGSASERARLLRNKPARSDGGSGLICRNSPDRQPDRGLGDTMAHVPPRWELRADFPLHFPLSVTCESAGSCRQPPPVAAVRAISPGDFRSLARKKWEVRKNIPHRIWLRVGPQGYRDGFVNRFPRKIAQTAATKAQSGGRLARPGSLRAVPAGEALTFEMGSTTLLPDHFCGLPSL